MYMHTDVETTDSMGEYCFTSLSAQSWQYRNRRKPEGGTMPYSSQIQWKLERDALKIGVGTIFLIAIKKSVK